MHKEMFVQECRTRIHNYYVNQLLIIFRSHTNISVFMWFLFNQLHNKTLTSRHHSKPKERMKLLRSGHGITALLWRKPWKIHSRAVKKMRETAQQKILNIKHTMCTAFAGTYDEFQPWPLRLKLNYVWNYFTNINVKLRSVISAGFKDRAKWPVLKGCMASLNI